jgi:glucosamine--fructose-6-phosphate aminotransferase (isomerizing)
VTISQSGETADTLASLRAAREKGCRILSLVNVMGSTIDRESDGVIYTHAGPEIGVASTKAYTAQLVSGILFGLWLGKIRGEIPAAGVAHIVKELRQVPQKMRQIFEMEASIAAIAAKYSKHTSASYLGRGFNYPGALEGALKNKEISYMHAEGTAAGEMKHGPIALIDKNLPVFCICPEGESYDKMISNMKEVEARNGRIIAIVTRGDQEAAAIAEDLITIPPIAEELSPLLVAIPLQLLAYYIALAKGCDIDQPRNLAKSVTVE